MKPAMYPILDDLKNKKVRVRGPLGPVQGIIEEVDYGNRLIKVREGRDTIRILNMDTTYSYEPLESIEPAKKNPLMS